MVSIFTRKITSDLASLVKQIDSTVGKNSDQKMAAFVVYLSDDPDAGEAKLKAFAKEHGIKNTPLTVFQTSEGPQKYKISQDAEITVLLWKNLEVKANHAFGEDKLTEKDIKGIVADTSKILK